MAEAPSLSVVIPAYNGERYLERAVASVLATEYPSIEVLIVDDGSEDRTGEIADRLCAVWAGQCRLLRHPDGGNHGVSASRNLGISASNSEWVALLDADDFYLPHRFTAFRGLLAEGRAFDASYQMCEIRGDERGDSPSPNPDVPASNRFGIDRELTGAALLGALLQGKCWATSAITIRRNLLKRVGLFDPRKRIAEDCDLWFRIAAVGRVLAGDLESPISVYWRHANNTYRYDAAHRVPMVRAMLDAWRWSRAVGTTPEVLAAFSVGVPNYAMRSILATREAGRVDIAAEIMRLMMAYGQLRFLTQRRTLRQIAALALEFWRRRYRPSAVL